MPACSKCGIAWTEELVVNCPRCRYRPRGDKAIDLIGYTLLVFFGPPLLIYLPLAMIFARK